MTQCSQDKQPNQKMGRRPKQTCSKADIEGQEAHEKMTNMAKQQRHANQNHNEVTPHAGQNGYHRKIYK